MTLIKIDEVGRVVIPISLRKAIGLEGKGTLQIEWNEKHNYICLKPLDNACVFCGSKRDITEIKRGIFLCRACAEKALCDIP